MSLMNFGEAPPLGDWVRSYLSEDHLLFASLHMEATKVAADEVSVFATIPAYFADRNGDVRAHSGAYTIILDTVFGFAVFAKMQNPRAIATINLKTEYLRPVDVGSRVICSAECHSINGSIARTRGEIVDYDGRPLASATGAFMIGSGGPDFGKRPEEPAL